MTDARTDASSPLAKSAAAANDDLPSGLTGDEARRRLEKFGPNAVPDTALHPLRLAIEKFWAPVPWMLEAAVVLELALGKYVEGGIIAALLVFNAALGLLQESRAQATLAALKSRLALNAAVRRDGAWKTPMLLKTVQSKKIDPTRLITHRFKLDQIVEAYDMFARAADTHALKVIIAA
jgi:H+-transporting ATPase